MRIGIAVRRLRGVVAALLMTAVLLAGLGIGTADAATARGCSTAFLVDHRTKVKIGGQVTCSGYNGYQVRVVCRNGATGSEWIKVGYVEATNPSRAICSDDTTRISAQRIGWKTY